VRRIVIALLVVATGCTTGDVERDRSDPTATAGDAVDFAPPRRAGFGESVRPSCPDDITPDVDTFTWRKGAPMAVPRTEVAAAALGGRVYVAGGFTGNGRASAVVEAYDTKADRWSRIADLPEPRHHPALAAADGRLWLIGGYDDEGEPRSTVWSWSPDRPGWNAGPALPSPRGALAAAVVHDRVHAIGGATGLGGANRLSDEHAVLAPGSDQWTLLDPLPVARDHLAAAGIATMTSTGGKARRSGQVFVTGGRHLSLDTNEARMDVFNVDSIDGGTIEGVGIAGGHAAGTRGHGCGRVRRRTPRDVGRRAARRHDRAGRLLRDRGRCLVRRTADADSQTRPRRRYRGTARVRGRWWPDARLERLGSERDPRDLRLKLLRAPARSADRL
jgi:hypothetical protein